MQSVSIYSHKTNETRDRLRTRLNQRKEKLNGRSASNPKLLASSNPNSCVKSVYTNPNTKVPLSTNTTQKTNTVIKKPDSYSSPAADSIPTPTGHTTNAPNLEFLKNNSLSKLSIANTKSSSDSSALTHSVWSLSTCSLNSLKDNTDSRDINDLLNYIEGNRSIDKVALAEKKAAKKARQRQKKVCIVSTST